MARLTLDADTKSVTTTMEKVEEAVEDALSESTGKVLDEAIDIGKTHITDQEAVWRGEVLGRTMHADFDYTELSKADQYTIWNSSMHAGIVDKGTEFASPPNITRLIPYVLENMQDWHPFDYDDDDDAPDTVDFDKAKGGGLDAIAAQIGTTTEEQDSHTGAVSGIDFRAEREPYDDSVMGVFTNDKQGKPSPLSYEISTEVVNYDNTDSITATHDEAAYTHAKLAETERKALFDRLSEEFGDETVTTIEDRLYEWKKSTDSMEAQWFEKIAKENYDVGAGVRFTPKYDAPEPDRETLDAYHELSVASQEFLRRHFADNDGKITAYRGFRDPQVAALASQIFSRPNEEKWSFEDSVIQNYALGEGIAEGFSEGVEVQITFDVDEHLLLAPDFISNSPISDSEVNLVGGPRSFGREELSFSGIDVDTILEKDVSSFNSAEHDAMHALVDQMYGDEALVSNPEQSDRLTEWADEYLRSGGEDSEIVGKVAAVTADVYPESDDSVLTWANLDPATYDGTEVEEGDVLDTQFGYERVIDPAGLTTGWNGEEEYLLQPGDGNQWEYHSIRENELVHIGTTEVDYSNEVDSDPTLGHWTEYHDTGGETVHVYHESDAPDEVTTQYITADTIGDPEWLEDMEGATFLVRGSDGAVFVATLYDTGEGFKLVRQDNEQGYNWYPSGHDKADLSQVEILGVPNEGN